MSECLTEVSAYDLRIFGKKKGKTPNEVSGFAVDRDPPDSRRATVKWTKVTWQWLLL